VAERRSEPGPIVERAIETLRELPAIDGDTLSRVVATAARTRAQDTAPDGDDLLPEPSAPPPRYTRRMMAAAAAVVIAAGVIALWRATHVFTDAARGLDVATQPVVVGSPVARSMNGDSAPIPTQFVFDGHAQRVSLVGDFNNWDSHATPLQREPGSALWSVTVPIQRGRHVYAFLVDSVWTVDKRAPIARDPDFGVTGSVILVGRP
jgi:Glycogen recognition site of AMP-activated protein kinase